MNFLGKYVQIKKRNAKIAWKKAKMSKTCYLFLLPYLIVFTAFYILPVLMSVFYSFTYYNVLEPARFVGVDNYIDLLLADDVFLIAVKNTFLLAAITGPLGYIMAFLFAWFINELPRYIRAFAVCVFYAPTISGQAYLVWSILFSGDAYGYVNSFLIKFGLISEPILWLTDTKYMMNVIIIVVLWMSLGQGFLSFVAGLQGIDNSQFEAGYVDGVKNRWQELWYITLPEMGPQLMFGSVLAITKSFGFGQIVTDLCGLPSVNYSAHTIMNHLQDYGGQRFEVGYSSTIAVVLFVMMVGSNLLIKKMLSKVGK